MVWKDFQFQDFTTCLGGDLADDDLETFGYFVCQYLPAVLWTEYHVVLAGVGHVIVGLVLLRHAALYHVV